MVSILPGHNTSGHGTTKNKFISPTIRLGESAIDELTKFHSNSSSSSSFSASASVSASNSAVRIGEPASSLMRRFMQPVGLEVKEANYKVGIPDFATLSPLTLGAKLISNISRIDSSVPHDIFASENMIKNETNLDNYYFDYENGLKDFSRFEKVQQYDLPDTFFEEYNKTECITKIGLLPEIDRSWISVDNKLILWNYKIPQSSFNKSAQFLTLDQIESTVLAIKLVKPKDGIFLKEINHLLIVATVTSIQIFLVKYGKEHNNLEVFNPDLSVSVQGLTVNNIIAHPKTQDIYFTGEGSGTNIWRLEYSNKSSFTKNRCDKVCLTKSTFSSVLPSSFLSFGFASNTNTTPRTSGTFSASSALSSSASASAAAGAAAANIPETISQLEIDSGRDILYSLSNKSVIRVYKLIPRQDSLNEGSTLTPTQIFKSASSVFVDPSSFKVFERFKIINIHAISSHESSVIQLIAVTSNGTRILLKLGSTSSFTSLLSSAITSSAASKLNLVNIRFPPTREIPEINNELDSFTRDRQYISQIIANQQKSQLLKNTKIAKMISPGVFICVKKTKRSDKLFIATTNFGYLKKNGKLVEDAEFIKYTTSESSPYTYIQGIVQLNDSMNATNTPNGYANIAASQYTKEPLRIAILTNFGIMVYQYRTPDQILRPLKDEVVENFMEENGYEETCSTLLYLACSYGQHDENDLFERKAQVLFSTCGNNARLGNLALRSSTSAALIPHHQQFSQSSITAAAGAAAGSGGAANGASASNNSQPTVEQVVLSDRFYGTCLLISRFLKDIWNQKVFTPVPTLKLAISGDVEVASIGESKVIIQSVSIDKKVIEYFIGTIVVLIDFFQKNGNNIQGLNAPNFSSDPLQYENEVCVRAENIAFTSILKSLKSMKEAFSFLLVLVEEYETKSKSTGFGEILELLSLQDQTNLLVLRFKDILLPSREVRSLIKSLTSALINQSISKGFSIDLIATSLQQRCGSFCSTNDVFTYKATEYLMKAKETGSRDVDFKLKCLKNAVLLFEEAYDTLSVDTIEKTVDLMTDLEFYLGAINMLLNIALKVNNASKIQLSSISQISDQSFNSSLQNESSAKVNKIYQIIFSILVKVDFKALKISETNNQLLINEFLEVRELAYNTCFASKSKDFHFLFYEWFIEQGLSERLLDVNTVFILPFLELKAENNIGLTNVLWLYHAKRDNYFEAAKILYALSISQFDLSLDKRIEYLSRANGFCNCVCPPDTRQKMVQLSLTIQELFEVADIQLAILRKVESDARINAENRKIAVEALSNKILSISDLFNSYVDPLGYYELSLLIFKVSDYQNVDDILKRWSLLFERIFRVSKSSKEPFYILLNEEMALFGPKLSDNDIVFPVDELVKLISKTLHEAIDENSVVETPPKGYLVDLFVKCGVPYEKLYYSMRGLIEDGGGFEVFTGFTKYLKENEMAFLLKKWYATDKRLKELISADQIVNFGDVYSLEMDPVRKSNYV